MSKYTVESSGAFVSTATVDPNQHGVLDGLTFAVKDNIDVANLETSFGSLPWLETHDIAVSHALCVEQLLNEGATCKGKTVSDELTCSLDGESYFYGTPLNPLAPLHVPGGSSSGSASAVACGLVDFSLATDSAGSTRIPASNCGLFGMRPSTHRISESGVIPFSPTTSTVGILAKEYHVLDKVIKVLLSTNCKSVPTLNKIYLLSDAFDNSRADVSDLVMRAVERVSEDLNVEVTSIRLADIVSEEITLSEIRENIFSPIQCVEIYNAVGGWVNACKPKMGPRVTDAIEHFKQFDRRIINTALSMREFLFQRVSSFLKPGELFCFPTAAQPAPLKNELNNMDWCKEYYSQLMNTTSFSSVCSLPEISIPGIKTMGLPIGLSFAATFRNDEFLLASVNKMVSAMSLNFGELHNG